MTHCDCNEGICFGLRRPRETYRTSSGLGKRVIRSPWFFRKYDGEQLSHAKSQSKPVNRFNQWKCHQCRKRKEEERTHTAWAGSDSYSLDTWLAATQVGDTATCLRKTIQGHASSIDRSTCRLRLHAVPIVAGKAVGLRPSGINRMVDQRLQ